VAILSTCTHVLFESRISICELFYLWMQLLFLDTPIFGCMIVHVCSLVLFSILIIRDPQCFSLYVISCRRESTLLRVDPLCCFQPAFAISGQLGHFIYEPHLIWCFPMTLLAKLGAPIWTLSIVFLSHLICSYSRSAWLLSLDRERTPLEEMLLA
jgi:hypothetical protein